MYGTYYPITASVEFQAFVIPHAQVVNEEKGHKTMLVPMNFCWVCKNIQHSIQNSLLPQVLESMQILQQACLICQLRLIKYITITELHIIGVN